MPGSEAAVESTIPFAFGEDRIVVTRYFVPDASAATPQALLDARVTKWNAPIVIGVTTLATLGFWLFRRQEFALYRTLGLRARGLLLMLSVEWIAIVLAPMAAAALGCALVLNSTGARGVAVLLTAISVLQIFALATLIPLIGLAALSLRSSLDLLRSR